MARNTSASLGEHFDEFIAQQLSVGRYGTACEVVRAALRLFEELQDKLHALRKVPGESKGSGFDSYSLASVISELDENPGG